MMKIGVTKDCVAIEGKINFCVENVHWEIRYQYGELIFFMLFENDDFVSKFSCIKGEIGKIFDFEEVDEYTLRVKYREREVGHISPYGDGTGVFWLSLSKLWEVIKEKGDMLSFWI